MENIFYTIKPLTEDSDNNPLSIKLDVFNPIIVSKDTILNELLLLSKEYIENNNIKLEKDFINAIKNKNIYTAVEIIHKVFNDIDIRNSMVLKAAFSFVLIKQSTTLVPIIVKFLNADTEPLVLISMVRLLCNADHLDIPPNLIENKGPYDKHFNLMENKASNVNMQGYANYYISNFTTTESAINTYDIAKTPKSSLEDKKYMKIFFFRRNT